MKLQNLSVIFIVIAIPIILLVSYYISMQIDTINMQTAYDQKLRESIKDAVQAFEINTVEWNEAYSELGDSKRRDVNASINTFIRSFSNSTGISGTSKEDLLAHIPAIAYTLYDGYYIYTPSEVKRTITDDNEVVVALRRELVRTVDEPDRPIELFGDYDDANTGKILYEPADGATIHGTYNGQNFTLNADQATTEYKHILKPFNSYSARYVNGRKDVVVNYTLDNYITIYGDVDDGKGYQTKAGYLVNTDENEGVYIHNSGSIFNVTLPDGTTTAKILDISGNIKIKGKEIETENLSEKISYIYGGTSVEARTYTYVYEAENNTKVYFDGTVPFQVSSTGERTDLNIIGSVKYKKLTLPVVESGHVSRYLEVYQALNTSIDGTIQEKQWFTKKNDVSTIITAADYGIDAIDLDEDCSAINYCVESYIFSNWIYDKLSNITVGNIQIDAPAEDDMFVNGGSIIFDPNNPPYDATLEENKSSVFESHKRDVIKQTIISNLNQAITSYARNNTDGQLYELPILLEEDWNQLLTNTSIIAFVQGIPIGLKYYNNYAIATSTSNKEYVDPNEIYINSDGDNYYHTKYCSKTHDADLVGYRSIDYIVKEKVQTEDEIKNNDPIKYYYKHAETNNAVEACYECLIQSSLYTEEADNTKKGNQEDAYQTALSRERYIAKINEIPGEIVVTPVAPAAPLTMYTIYATGNPSCIIKKDGSQLFSTIYSNNEGAYYEIVNSGEQGAELVGSNNYRTSYTYINYNRATNKTSRI